MPETVNASREGMDRQGAGSIARLASGLFGDQIRFEAPGGSAEGAAAPGASGAGASDKGAGNGDAGAGGDKTGDAGAGDGAAGAGNQKPARPEGLSDDFWDKDRQEVKFKDLTGKLSELTAFKAAADSRAAQVPEAADKYEVKLPEGFKLPDTVKLPEGQKVEVNKDDPRLAMAREFAHKHGFTQADFEEMVAMGFNADLAEMGQLQAAQEEQVKALGSRGAERADAVKTWLRAQLGDDLASSLTRVMFASKQIQAVEKLMSLFRHDSPGRPGGGREGGGDPGKIDGYENMSFRQRMAAIDARKART